MNIYQEGGIKYGTFNKELTFNRPIVDKGNFTKQIGKTQKQINQDLINLKKKVFEEKETKKRDELERYNKAKRFHENNPLAFNRKKNPTVLPKQSWKENLDDFSAGIEDFYKIPNIGIANDFINPLHLVSSGIISPIASSFKQSEDIDNYYKENPNVDPLFFNKNVDKYIPYGLAGISTAMTTPFIKPSVNFVKGVSSAPRKVGQVYRDIKYPTNTITKNGKLYHNSYDFLKNNEFNKLSKKEIKFLNKEIEDRGILESQRRHPFNINSELSSRGIVAEDYNIKKAVKDFIPNILKGKKHLKSQYTMGQSRIDAFDHYLGKPIKNNSYRIHSNSFKNNNGLVYTIPENLINRSGATQPVQPFTKEEFRTLSHIEDFYKNPSNQNKSTLYKQLTKQYGKNPIGLTSYKEFNPDLFLKGPISDYGVPIIKNNKTVFPSWDYITGTGGNAPFIKKGNKITLKDIWDIQPFSRSTRLPKFIQNFNANKILGGKDFMINQTYTNYPNRIIQTFKKGGNYEY